MRETLEEAGYTLVAHTHHNEVILKDGDNVHLEVWQKHDDHAGYTVEINGVGYEFVRTALATDIQFCIPVSSEHWHEDFELESRRQAETETA